MKKYRSFWQREARNAVVNADPSVERRLDPEELGAYARRLLYDLQVRIVLVVVALVAWAKQ